MIKISQLLVTSFIAILLIPAGAIASPAEEQLRAVNEKREAAQQKVETVKEKVEDKRNNRPAKLEAKNLEICKNKEQIISNKMSHIVLRTNNQLDVFTKIADRTQAYYIEKGVTLENYDNLVADVNSKKQAAEAVVDKLNSANIEFKCDATDPKGVVASFKASQSEAIAALKEYKKAVNNLIVGVKSAKGTAE